MFKNHQTLDSATLSCDYNGEIEEKEVGHRCDINNFPQFESEMHAVMDACLERMKTYRTSFWQPPPASLRDSVRLDTSSVELKKGKPSKEVFHKIVDEIMPYSTGNTHPCFFGWVHGSGLPVACGADLIASTMNVNLGGRNQGATEVERSVIEFLISTVGWSTAADNTNNTTNGFGILTSGTSQATILALAAARVKLFGVNVRKTGIRDLPPVKVYISKDAHSCIGKALEILGHGSNCVSKYEDVDELRQMVANDRANGFVPLCIVGTAGSVNKGYYDDLTALGEYAQSEDIWYHIDAAFGFWILLADEPYRNLIDGIHLASSIATDFHKWMSIQYDCGACLIRDSTIHKATFTSRPSYLSDQGNNHSVEGLGGGDLWFCDYGMELSRGFKALKVWACLSAYGTNTFGAYITDNCELAKYMAERIQFYESSDSNDTTDVNNKVGIKLAFSVVSNVCCMFLPEDIQCDPNEMASRLQLKSKVVFSTTLIDGKSALRAAIVNHRTTRSNIFDAVEAVKDEIMEIRKESGKTVK
jgi:aromatic-L-amino-acid/L-tryptophan decarboxylase